MKTLLYGLFALLLAVIVGSLAGSDTGYAVITIAGWSMQTSTALFIIILLVSFIVFYTVIRGLVRLLQMPGDIKKWRDYRRQCRAEAYLSNGLILLAEGKWKKAERIFRRAALCGRSPYINYLYAARAAQEQGAIERRDEFLKQAYQVNPDDGLVVGITQAKLQLEQKQTELALATLQHLQSKQPEQTQVKKLLLHTYTELQDWQSMLKLIPVVEKSGIYTREQIEAAQLEAYAGLMKKAGGLNKKDDLKDDLNEVWISIPRKLRQHFYLIEVYVSERLRFDNTEDCEELLRDALKKQWDSILIRLYGLVTGKDTNRQLQVAESYLNSHSRDAALLLTLGRICLRNKLWGKARDYLRESIDAQPNPEAYYELAKLHELEGRKEQATICYRQGLALAANTRY